MKTVIAICAVIWIAGSSASQSLGFSLLGVQSGDVDGTGFQTGSITASTSFFQNSMFGGDFIPSSAFIGLVPELAFDSYVHIGWGPQTATTAFSPAVTSPGVVPEFSDTELTGQWLNSTRQPFEAVFLPSFFRDGVFLGRYTTIGAGSTISGSIALLDFFEPGFDDFQSTRFAEVEINRPGVGRSLEGVATISPGNEQTILTADLYAARTISQEVQLDSGDTVVVHDLYFAAVPPAPGSAVLFAVAGVSATRRRRG